MAIAGGGMVGSYLYKLLQAEGIKADIYDQPNGHMPCGIHPCAWGSSKEFPEHLAAVGIDARDYVLRVMHTIRFEGVDLDAFLLTFDKPRLIRDLRDGAEVIHGKIPPGRYARVVDATGVARAFLPPIANDLIVPCVQYRVRSDAADASKVVIEYGNVGYSWSFPLSARDFHMGAGSAVEDPRLMFQRSGMIGNEARIHCGCQGKVRSTSPDGALPFVSHHDELGCDAWGVGEAIGAVAPIAGEGIAPGMKCARLLLKNWDDGRRYTKSVLKEFAWMEGERRVIGRVTRKETLSLKDWLVLRHTGRRMGAHVSLSEVRGLLKCLSNDRPLNDGTGGE